MEFSNCQSEQLPNSGSYVTVIHPIKKRHPSRPVARPGSSGQLTEQHLAI